MTGLTGAYISSADAARVLGVHPMAMQALCRSGRLPAEKIANRWLIRQDDLEMFAKTYVPNVGRPRQKRKYTRRKPV